MSATAAFDRLCEVLLAREGVTLGRALSAPGLMVGGQLFAFLASADELSVKLPAARVTELSAAGVGAPMTMGTRVMREWIGIPYADAPAPAGGLPVTWANLAEEAMAYVATLPPRVKRPMKKR